MIGKAIKDKIQREVAFGECSYKFSVGENNYCLFTERTGCGEEGDLKVDEIIGLEYKSCKLE